MKGIFYLKAGTDLRTAAVMRNMKCAFVCMFAGIIVTPNSGKQSTNSEQNRGSNCATNRPDTGATAFAFCPSLCAINFPNREM